VVKRSFIGVSMKISMTAGSRKYLQRLEVD
jgi:hypothetical protein